MVTEFRKYGHIESFDIGTRISKDSNNGVVIEVIFPRCYLVRWENGQENHVYHHEVVKTC